MSDKIEYPEVNITTPFPSIEFPYEEGQPVIVMLAGFPDHCTSGFREVLNELIRSEKYRIICLCLPDYQSNCEKPKPWVLNFINFYNKFVMIIMITIIITITITIRVIPQWNYYHY